MQTLIKVQGALKGATVRPLVAQRLDQMAEVLEFQRRSGAASALCGYIVRQTGLRTLEDVVMSSGLSFSAFLSLASLVSTEEVNANALRNVLGRAAEYPMHRRGTLASTDFETKAQTRMSPAPNKAGVSWSLPPDEQKDVFELAQRLKHADTAHFISAFASHVLADRRIDVLAGSFHMPALTLARWLLRVATGRSALSHQRAWIEAAESFPEARIRQLCALR